MRRNRNAALLSALKGAPKKRKKTGLKKKAPRKPKKSNFVRFFESLEERGPLTMSEGKLYDCWTEKVRVEMQTAGSWPKNKQKPKVEIVAEYVSRLMEQFWKSAGERKWYRYIGETWRLSDELKLQTRVFGIIYTKIRNKGQRDRTFELARATTKVLNDGFVREGWNNHNKKSIPLTPYTPFNDHAVHI